jgi:hypothetical protein
MKDQKQQDQKKQKKQKKRKKKYLMEALKNKMMRRRNMIMKRIM